MLISGRKCGNARPDPVIRDPVILVSKAQKLASDFADLGNIQGCGFDELAESGHFDLIINGTSASLAGEIAPLPNSVLTANTQGYDMMYAA